MAASGSVREIELKLAVPHGALKRLAGHSLLRGRGRPVTRKLHAVYFDTPALDLWRRGVALRVRREGRRWIQTVKGDGVVQGGLHQRDELETQVPGPQPDLGRLADGELAAVLRSPHVRAQLRPVFVTEFSRSQRILEPVPGVAVEAAIDSGEIKVGGRRDAINEVELELKQGEPWQLFDLALRLLKEVPVAVENRSKAERGFALARGRRPVALKGRPARLSGDMTISDGFKAVVWANLAHLQANERGMVEGTDPEYLHQMRVAVRRLRSAFSVFAPLIPAAVIRDLAAELKWLGNALGPARDWDVFVTETLPPLAAEFGEHPALAAFTGQCAAPRRAAGRKARRAVRSPRYQRLVLTLAACLTAGRWEEDMDAAGRAALAAPVAGFAGAVLDARYGKVRKRGRRMARLSPGELHRLRIAIKKFRYATDFFASLYEGRRARETLKRLARLQDVLGAINDAATVANLVSDVQRGANGRNPAEARGILLGWSRGRAAALRRELKPAWKAFLDAEKFW